MNRKATLLLLLNWSMVLAASAQVNGLQYERTLHTATTKIGLNLYAGDLKVTAKEDRMYFWVKSQELHSSQGDYAGQLLDGDYVCLDQDNNLLEKGRFRAGLKSGVWRLWHTNGSLNTVARWRNGRLDGWMRIYDESGSLVRLEPYHYGLLHGKVKEVENGQVISETRYKNGEPAPERNRPFKNLKANPLKPSKKEKADAKPSKTERKQQEKNAGKKARKKQEKANKQATKTPEKKAADRKDQSNKQGRLNKTWNWMKDIFRKKDKPATDPKPHLSDAKTKRP